MGRPRTSAPGAGPLPLSHQQLQQPSQARPAPAVPLNSARAVPVWDMRQHVVRAHVSPIVAAAVCGSTAVTASKAGGVKVSSEGYLPWLSVSRCIWLWGCRAVTLAPSVQRCVTFALDS